VKDFAGTGVVSECGGCRVQIGRSTGASTIHPISLLRQAYRV
jgi:glycerol-3-phosphate dehydrogenase subunit C